MFLCYDCVSQIWTQIVVSVEVANKTKRTILLMKKKEEIREEPRRVHMDGTCSV